MITKYEEIVGEMGYEQDIVLFGPSASAKTTMAKRLASTVDGVILLSGSISQVRLDQILMQKPRWLIIDEVEGLLSRLPPYVMACPVRIMFVVENHEHPALLRALRDRKFTYRMIQMERDGF